MGVVVAIVALVAGLFVHPAFLVTAMFVILIDIYLNR
jgi:hypothetical protein